VIAQRAPVTLTLVRRHTQPAAATIARLAASAVFAYIVALAVPGTSPPVLAPLTALLVVQVSVYQTIRSAVRRVASVVAGVLIALGLSVWMGLTWWSLGITVVLALAAGWALRVGDQLLEVPISAMLILSVGSRTAAIQRVVETLIGTAAGLAAGFILTSPRVQEAGEAVTDLGATMARLLGQMAAGIGEGLAADRARGWLAQARTLSGEIARVCDALALAEESTRLNPRGPWLTASTIALRDNLEALEHGAIIVRALARTLADAATLDSGANPVSDPDVRGALAAVLQDLAGAVRAYGNLAGTGGQAEEEPLRSELRRYLASAREWQDRLREQLAASPSARPAAWPLRGELISHLDRLIAEIEAPAQDRRRRDRARGRRYRRYSRPDRATRLLLSPAWRKRRE
jgi:uncharacterized membrane protein YgaE (UPF0421/DUF939 family)